MRWWREAATQGDGDAMFELAISGMLHGRMSPEEAVEWLRLAAQRGHQKAISFMAAMKKCLVDN
jgi:TPR repeat protein